MQRPSRLLRAFSVFVGALFAVEARTDVRAATPGESMSVALTWNAPAECPTEAEVLAEVARVLDGRRKDRVAVATRVDVERTPSARWRGTISLEIRDARSTRGFEAETCAGIASGAALIIAVTVEGGALPPSSSSPPPATAPPDATVATVVKTASPPPPALPSQLVVTTAGVLDTGLMPGTAAAGVEGALGWSRHLPVGRVRALVGAAYFPGRTTAPGSAGEGGQFSLLALSLRVCGAAAFGRFQAGPCLGAEMSRMSASGFGPATRFEEGDASSWWGAGVAGAAASWSLSPGLAVFARGEMVVTAAQQRFVVQPGSALVHSPARAAGRAALGIQLLFF
jgi:hypothetical protein